MTAKEFAKSNRINIVFPIDFQSMKVGVGSKLQDPYTFAEAYADKVKLEHTIEALEDIFLVNADDIDTKHQAVKHYQKQLEQLKTK